MVHVETRWSASLEYYTRRPRCAETAASANRFRLATERSTGAFQSHRVHRVRDLGIVLLADPCRRPVAIIVARGLPVQGSLRTRCTGGGDAYTNADGPMQEFTPCRKSQPVHRLARATCRCTSTALTGVLDSSRTDRWPTRIEVESLIWKLWARRAYLHELRTPDEGSVTPLVWSSLTAGRTPTVGAGEFPILSP